MNDLKASALVTWLQGITSHRDLRLLPLQGDASHRRYFTLDALPDKLAVYAPPSTENNQGFLAHSKQLLKIGMNAPAVHAHCLERGYFLIDHLSGPTYFTALNEDNADTLYRQAIEALLLMQKKLRHYSQTLPIFDDAFMQRELDLFDHWFVQQHLHQHDASWHHAWQQAYQPLIRSIDAIPKCFVHRDFHSRNLLVHNEHTPAILDFQDAVLGPITYDLVSLLRDCYVAWPASWVHTWRDHYHQHAKQLGLLSSTITRDDFQHLFNLTGIQRHLKAIGIFARKWHRDRDPRYLADIPRTLGYLENITPLDSSTKPLHAFICYFQQALPLHEEITT